METLTHEITLGFSNESGILNIPISQYDVNRIISIGFTDYGEEFEIPENTMVFLKAKKPDGTEINTDEFCTVVDNKVQLQIFEQLSVADGIVQCEIILSDVNGTHYTSNHFNFIVNKSVHNDENLRSSDTYKNIADILLELNGIREYINTNESDRIENENTRKSNELQRIADENERKNTFSNVLEEAQGHSDNAKQHSESASISEENSETYAKQSKSYAVGDTGIRDGENTDNAKYYYEKTKNISQDIGSILIPKGTVAFSDLPALSDAGSGWMYNIADQFTTTEDFNEGAGNVIPSGANVYKTADGKWDVLAGTPVSTVNGQTGNVNITAESINAIVKTGDSSQTTVTFEQATARANVQPGDDLATAFAKLSRYCADLKNVAFTGAYGDLTGTPQSLKNPNALTFTGAVTGSYDGSATKSVAIPSGTNNLLATNAGTWLDAVQGKALNDKITQLNSDLEQTGILKNGNIYNAYVQTNNYGYASGLSTDLNDYKKVGAYDCTNNFLNTPVSDGWGTVNVFGTVLVITQMFSPWNYSIIGDIYVRTCVNGTWSTWKKLNLI